MLFPGRKFPILVDPKQISVIFKSEKQKKKKKKKKKKGPQIFLELFLLPFPILNLPFTIFLLFFSIFTPFPFFPSPIFPDTSAKISRSEVSGGALCPPAPHLLRHCPWGPHTSNYGAYLPLWVCGWSLPITIPNQSHVAALVDKKKQALCI